MFHYKKEIPAMTDLLALYSSVGWTNYTNNPAMLEEAVKASLWQLAVYDEKELVAYIRLVGDGHSVLFSPGSFGKTRSPAPRHRKEKLLTEALATFPNVYQRLLVTERSEKNLAFTSLWACRTFRASMYRDDLYEIESGIEIGNSLEFDFVVPLSAQLSRAVKADETSVVEATQPLRLARHSKKH